MVEFGFKIVLKSLTYKVGASKHRHILFIARNEGFRVKRVAILISHAHQEPFTSLLNQLERPSTLNFDEFKFDVFYFEGRRNRFLEGRIRTIIEKIRYSPMWPLLNIYDTFFLKLMSITLPIARLETDYRGRKFLRVDSPEDQRHIAKKLYSALSFCFEEEYDFVVRTTSNSLFNIKKLSQFLREINDKEILYAGREVKSLNRPSFISGSFLILNKRSVENLLRCRKHHNFGVLDDVAIGRIFANEIGDLSKVYLQSIDLPNLESIAKISKHELGETIHFRCKSSSIPRIDVEIVTSLTKLLSQLEIPHV